MTSPLRPRPLIQTFFILFLIVLSSWILETGFYALRESQTSSPKVNPTATAQLIARTIALPLIQGNPGLKTLAGSLGITRVGVVVNQGYNYPHHPNAVSNTLLPDFNSLTIGTEMKMAAIHPCPPRAIYDAYLEVRNWVANQEEDDRCYAAPTNPLISEWEVWEWEWSAVDSIVTYAKNHELGVYGHTLVFHESTPGWLSAIHDAYPTTNAQVAADIEWVMKEHIETVMERHCGSQFLANSGQPVVYAYDVVNEPTRGSPDPNTNQYLYPVTPFIRINFTDINSVPLNVNHYVREAFSHARGVLNNPATQLTANAPCLNKDIKLIYNDKGTQTTQAWADGIYLLVESLTTDLTTGQPLTEPLIDAVGFQLHIAVYPEAVNQEDVLPDNFDNIQAEMARAAQLGVEVLVTELDVALRRAPVAPHYCGYASSDPNKQDCSIPNPASRFSYPLVPNPDQNERSQAWVYQYVIEACRAVPQCTGISFWGLHDENSWLYQFHPHLFNQMPPVVYVATPTTLPASPTPLKHIPTATSPGSQGTIATLTPTATATRTPTPLPRMTPKPAYYAVRTALAVPTFTASPTGQPLVPSATTPSGSYPAPLLTATPQPYP